MAGRIPNAKITDLVTTVDTTVVESSAGPRLWATVEICYASEGLEPRVSIRVPVPAFEIQSDEERRAEAVRRARMLINHACITMGPDTGQGVEEVVVGLAEELGLMSPTASPTRGSHSAG